MMKSHSSVELGRKRKRDEPQSPTSSLNSGLDRHDPLRYPIVEGFLALEVFENDATYQLQLVDGNNHFIQNTSFFTDKDIGWNIINFIGKRDSHGLIRYLSDNRGSKQWEDKREIITTIIERIFYAEKRVIFKHFPPIRDAVYPRLPMPILANQYVNNSAIAQGSEPGTSSIARDIYSGASGSPVYRSSSPSVSKARSENEGTPAPPFYK